MLIKKIVMLLSTYFLTISCIAQPPNDRVELDDESREASTNTIEAYESDALYPGWWDTKFNLWPPYVYQYKNGKLFFYASKNGDKNPLAYDFETGEQLFKDKLTYLELGNHLHQLKSSGQVKLLNQRMGRGLLSNGYSMGQAGAGHGCSSPFDRVMYIRNSDNKVVEEFYFFWLLDESYTGATDPFCENSEFTAKVSALHIFHFANLGDGTFLMLSSDGLVLRFNQDLTTESRYLNDRLFIVKGGWDEFKNPESPLYCTQTNKTDTLALACIEKKLLLKKEAN